MEKARLWATVPISRRLCFFTTIFIHHRGILTTTHHSLFFLQYALLACMQPAAGSSTRSHGRFRKPPSYAEVLGSPESCLRICSSHPTILSASHRAYGHGNPQSVMRERRHQAGSPYSLPELLMLRKGSQRCRGCLQAVRGHRPHGRMRQLGGVDGVLVSLRPRRTARPLTTFKQDIGRVPRGALADPSWTTIDLSH